MTKKLILGAVLGLIAVAGLKATKWFGYAKTEAHAWSEWADDQVPVEKKIAALRGDVAALDRDIEGTKNLLAKAIVDTRELSTDAARLRASLETDRKALLARGQKLKDGTEQVAVNKVDLADQKAKLDADVKSFDRRKHSLENMETSLAFHERNRDVLQKQLDTLVAQKLELQSAIDAFADRAQAPADGEQVPDGRHPAEPDQGDAAGHAEEARRGAGEAEADPADDGRVSGREHEERGRDPRPARRKAGEDRGGAGVTPEQSSPNGAASRPPRYRFSPPCRVAGRVPATAFRPHFVSADGFSRLPSRHIGFGRPPPLEAERSPAACPR